MSKSTSSNPIIEQSVIDILQYFSIFHFPLQLGEVHKYMNIKCSQDTLLSVLTYMVAQKSIYQIHDCYSLNENQNWVIEKYEGKKRAEKQLKRAEKISKFIFKFPYVKMVAISGSLSKNYSAARGDIDYFIITQHNRLWIARTCLHLFKKFTFLFGKQHDYCMNYFIDTSKLTLDEKNKFTAIEIRSLIPMEGNEVYHDFISQNNWVKDITPNNNFTNETSKMPQTEIKNNNGLLNAINRWLMNLTNTKWRRKWKKRGYDMNQYDLAFKTTLSVSKNHNKNFQKKVLDKYSK